MKKWAKKWDCCQGCGTTERPYCAKGLCRPCYMRGWRKGRGNCIDCGDDIGRGSTRCRSCATKACWSHGNYDDRATQEYRYKLSEATKAAWERGVFSTEGYVRKRTEGMKAAWARGAFEGRNSSEGIKAAWARGAYDSEEHRQKLSDGTKAGWARGVFDTEEWRRKKSEAVKAAWGRGDYGKECRRKMSQALKVRWVRGDFDDMFTKEVRRKLSEAMKARRGRGEFDDMYTEDCLRKMSEGIKAAWARGDMDGIFQSPTSIEIQIAAALDIMGIEHQPQYRPDGYSRIFDEFIPPKTLIEVNGDYWHGPKRPKQQKRDAEKAQWAKDNGYELIVIWEHEIQERGAWAIIAQAFG